MKRDFLAGFFMGAANTIPGISGGSVALIFGIYERLINTLAQFRLKNLFSPQKNIHWTFLANIFFGTICGVIICSLFIPYLLFKYETPMKGLFLGLILGSIPHMLTLYQDKIKIFHWVLIFLVFLITYWALGSLPFLQENNSPMMLFFAGVLAMCAMLLPGISGSFILLILGCYKLIFSSIQKILFFEFKFILLLAPFLAGMILGAIFCVNIINFFLKNFRSLTLCVLLGLMLGSLPTLWPFTNYLGALVLIPLNHNSNIIITLTCFFTGLLLSYITTKKIHA